MSTSAKPYHHGDLRTALLDAADALLDEGGDGAISLRETARRAGVSATAAYRHFADKDALLAALAARHFAQLGQTLGSVDFCEQGRAYVRFALARPGRFRLMFGPVLGRSKAHPVLEQVSEAVFGGLAAAAGSQDDALRAWALVHGLSHLLLDGAIGEVDAEDLIRRVIPDEPPPKR